MYLPRFLCYATVIIFINETNDVTIYASNKSKSQNNLSLLPILPTNPSKHLLS